MSWLYITQQTNIYGGFFLLVVGVVGNGINIYIFSSIRTYRTAPSSFFFLVGSINNLFYLLINLTLRILNGGYGIDFVNRSSIACKIWSFLLSTQMLVSITCSSLAAIDQFLATSRNEYFRRYRKIEWAHRILFVMIIVWCLHEIPCFLFFNNSSINHTCAITNVTYRRYTAINIFIILCIVPVVLLILFGYLTYQNIHRIRILAEEHIDHQLKRMTVIQIVLVIISIIPFGVVNVYIGITSRKTKDVNQQQKEYFILTIVSLLSYLHFAGNFYMFFISSSRFRRIVKDRIFCWRREGEPLPI